MPCTVPYGTMRDMSLCSCSRRSTVGYDLARDNIGQAGTCVVLSLLLQRVRNSAVATYSSSMAWKLHYYDHLPLGLPHEQ